MKLKIVVATYLIAVASGFAAWERYERRPGELRPSREAVEPRAEGCWTLTLYLHPHCPCGRTSVREFEGVVDSVRGGPCVRAEVVYARPESAGDDWVKLPGDRIPGV